MFDINHKVKNSHDLLFCGPGTDPEKNGCCGSRVKPARRGGTEEKKRYGKERGTEKRRKKNSRNAGCGDRKRASAARRKLFSFVIKQDQKEGGLMIVAG